MFRLMEGSSWDSLNNLRERIPRLPLRHTMPCQELPDQWVKCRTEEALDCHGFL
jgi:hypothetical protein